jgi:dynein heavy chain
LSISKLIIGKVLPCSCAIRKNFFPLEIDTHIKFLSDAIRWHEKIKNMIKTGLEEVGDGNTKGWFNTQQTDIQIYRLSKLSRFMKLIRLKMQDTLHSLIHSSVTSFVTLFRNAHASIRSKAEESREERSLRSTKRAILVVEFLVRQGLITLSTERDQAEKMLLNVIDSAIKIPQGLPDIEPIIVDKLFWADNPILLATYAPAPYDAPCTKTSVEGGRVLGQSIETFIQLQKDLICSMVQESYQTIMSLQTELKTKHEARIQLDAPTFMEGYARKEPEPTIDEMRADIIRLREEMNALESQIPRWIHIGAYQINTESIRFCVKKDLARCVVEIMAQKAHEYAVSIDFTYKSIDERLRITYGSIEEVAKLREYVDSLDQMEGVIQAKYAMQNMNAMYLVLEENLYEISRDEVALRWNAIGWPKKIDDLIAQLRHQIQIDEQNLLKALRLDQEAFADRVRAIRSTVSELQRATDLPRKATDLVTLTMRLDTEIKESQALIQILNMREKIFAIADGTKAETFMGIIKEFEPYKLVWQCWSDWNVWKNEWLNGNFHALDSEKIERDLTSALKAVLKSGKLLTESEDYSKMISGLKEDMEIFKSYLPIMQSLRHPGMRDRHWSELNGGLNLQLDPTAEGLTLTKILQMNVMENADTINRIGDFAAKEYAIESALNKMEQDWVPIKIEIIPYRETGTFISRIADEIIRQLDDHITMTQSMSFSPFKKVFQDRITNWNNQLRMAQDILDVLGEVQRSWLYLEPIFASPDITQQLPVESKKFFTADKTWRRVMAQIRDQPIVMRFTTDQSMLPALSEVVKVLEV